MKKSFFLFAIAITTGILFSCSQGGTNANDSSDKIIGKWEFKETYLGTVTYNEDGTAIGESANNDPHPYDWKMNKDENQLVTNDAYGEATYDVTFVGTDTLVLKMNKYIDQNGNEQESLAGSIFMLLRSE